MKNKKIISIIIVGCALILVLAGYGIMRQSDTKVQYREISLNQGDLVISIVSTGTVQPENRVEIKPPVAGRVESVLTPEGQRVKKGQVLAWMSSTERAAMLDSARARGPEELKSWEEMYRPTPIVAPIDGTVILRSVESGQTFTTSDAVLVMSDRLSVQAAVDETDLAQIKVQQTAEIRLDAYPNEVIPARVSRVAYEATTTNNVTTYKVYVIPDKTPDFMRSGMTANVTFFVNERRNVTLIDNANIKYEKGRPAVFVRNQEGRVQLRSLELGLSDGKKSEVLSDVEEGDVFLAEEVLNTVKEESKNPFMPSRPKSSGKSGSNPPPPPGGP
ncbi:MAG: efflux RND transporter periplasmic adaptor subunit [Bdellovibrio sp.]